MKIADRLVGGGAPCFVVAELGPNHEGQLQHAHWLIEAAAEAHADAVKFQLYRPEDLTLDRPDWRAPAPWDRHSLWDLYQRGQTPAEWLPELFGHARELGLVPFASAFAPWAVEALERLECPAYKVASLEIGELGLIRTMAETGKPVILSTGRATAEQIERALWVAAFFGNAASCAQAAPVAIEHVALLHCLAAYPAKLEDMNLRAIPALRERFGVPVGLSDHSRAPLVAELSVALGAAILEVHLTLPKPPAEDPLDFGHSLDPQEFKDMVEGVRQAERALGEARLGVREGERQLDGAIRRWVWGGDYSAGESREVCTVRSLRAPAGLPASEHVTPGPLRRDVRAGDPVLLEDFV